MSNTFLNPGNGESRNSSGPTVTPGQPAGFNVRIASLYPQQPNIFVPCPLQPSQSQPGSPSVPGNQSQQPQYMYPPGAYGMPPWPMYGQSPQQTGMQPGGGASPPQQQGQQSGTASPTTPPGPSDAPNAAYPTGPMWAGSFPPQPGQQFPSGTPAFSPQMGMYGMPPWAMAGPPAMPMSPNMTGSDSSQAQQAAMYQQHMQAAPWQFGPNGVPGWPAWPPSMYSMYPNAHPGFQGTPPAPIAPASPTSEGSESTSGRNVSPTPSAAPVPPPYTEPKSNEEPQKISNAVTQGDVPPFHISLLT
jgi:hypothetical protein